jgi:hypothetical protein
MTGWLDFRVGKESKVLDRRTIGCTSINFNPDVSWTIGT